jgi:cytochrome P450
MADLPELPYVRMVIEEALRLYPPAWITSRSPITDDEIGGYRIPAKALVFISPYVMHRHPAFWDAPETFDPGRFRPERVAQQARFTYLPFGAGPRQCIGNIFAMTEMHLIVTMVAQSYQLRLVPDYQLELRPLASLRLRHGMPMTLQRRHSGER